MEAVPLVVVMKGFMKIMHLLSADLLYDVSELYKKFLHPESHLCNSPPCQATTIAYHPPSSSINTTTITTTSAVATMPSPKTQYLLAYNFLSAILWSFLLLRILTLLPTSSPSQIYTHIGSYTRWTQTLALAEILHSALGLHPPPINQ